MLESVVEVVIRGLFALALGVFEAVVEAFLWIVRELLPGKDETASEWWIRKTKWQRIRTLLIAMIVAALVGALLLGIVLFLIEQFGWAGSL